MKEILKNKFLLVSLIFSIAILISGIIFPNYLIASLALLNKNILSIFSNYYLWIGLLIVVISIIILVLPISKKRLGSEDPEYSYFSWLALLYSTGMGSGLLLRAVQEPVFYLNNPPVESENPSTLSLQYTFFHWGFTPWAMYSLFGLIVAFNYYNKRYNNIVEAFIPKHFNKTLSQLVVLFIVLITIVGVIASLGLGSAQFVGGINQYFHFDLQTKTLMFTVFSIGLIATLSALTGINKVIKYLANFDFSFSILLMLYIGLFINFSSFITHTGSAFKAYAIHFIEMSLSIGNYKTSEAFTNDWTVFYWAFWLSWVPFTGIFIARISKGRTIREFIISTILIPSLATIIWFSIFGNSAFEIFKNGDSNQFSNLFTSLFEFLENFPLSEVTIVIAALLVLIAIINSVDSAIFVLGMCSDEGNENPKMNHKIGWGLIITATSIGLTALGAKDLLGSISNLLIILALPFSMVYVYIVYNFLKELIKDK